MTQKINHPCPRCGSFDIHIESSTCWENLTTMYYPLCEHCGYGGCKSYESKKELEELLYGE